MLYWEHDTKFAKWQHHAMEREARLSVPGTTFDSTFQSLVVISITDSAQTLGSACRQYESHILSQIHNPQVKVEVGTLA